MIDMQLLGQTLFIYYFITTWNTFSAILHSKSHNIHPSSPVLNQVSLTQKGYIQFLQYVTQVPPLTEFTFCIWVRSSNFTHSQPILSYSKHERERLIRLWIAPQGQSINLEILGLQFFELPMTFTVNRWYHICQSWSSYQAAWNLFINSKLESSGAVPQLRGIPIKGGGDIVVGQEYTDFDKGLDDGIEGDIFGFNFVLSSTIPKSTNPTFLSRSNLKKNPRAALYQYQPLAVTYRVPQYLVGPIRDLTFTKTKRISYRAYPLYLPNSRDKYVPKSTTLFDLSNLRPTVLDAGKVGTKLYDFGELSTKSVGVSLVELSSECTLGKGAPLSGKEVLISWTKTPVRIFGGALLKHELPFCV